MLIFGPEFNIILKNKSIRGFIMVNNNYRKMVNNNNYRKEEKTQGKSNAKKTALTFAAGALLALGGKALKALYDKHQSKNPDQDKKEDKKEIVAEVKTDSINADTSEFVNDKNNNGVVIRNSVVNGKTIIGNGGSDSINVNSSSDDYFDTHGKEVETIMNSDGMTIIYSDGTKVIMNGKGITTIKKNGDRQNVNNGKITQTRNGKTTIIQSGSGNTQINTMSVGNGTTITSSFNNTKANGISISTSNGKTTITKGGKTTTVNRSGNVTIVNDKVYIDGKPVDTGRDR
jgi:hypothetical protein